MKLKVLFNKTVVCNSVLQQITLVYYRILSLPF